MSYRATFGKKERFFDIGHQGYTSHSFGVPLTELLSHFISKIVVIYFV